MDGRVTVRKFIRTTDGEKKKEAGETEQRPNSRQRIETVRKVGVIKRASWHSSICGPNVHRACVSDLRIVIVLHFMVPVVFRSFDRSTEWLYSLALTFKKLLFIGTGQVCCLSLSKSHALYNMCHHCFWLKVVWNHKGGKGRETNKKFFLCSSVLQCWGKKEIK